MKETLTKYFRAWVDADAGVLETTFSDDAVYTECYGPEYHGLAQIRRWFADWNQKGRVLQWDLRRTVEQGRTIVAEWYFRCLYNGKTEGFDGVTVADFDDEGRIVRLSEFRSEAEHIFPYGE